MSSASVRTAFKTYLDSITAEPIVDLSGTFSELQEILTAASVTSTTPWIGLQFVGNDEIPITVGSGNTSGKYREVGTIMVHVVDVAKLAISDTILTRAETLRTALRGKVIGDIIIESVSPPNFESGATIEFDGGWMSATFFISYKMDLDL